MKPSTHEIARARAEILRIVGEKGDYGISLYHLRELLEGAGLRGRCVTSAFGLLFAYREVTVDVDRIIRLA